MNAGLGRANVLLFSQLSTKSGEKMSSYRRARNAQAVKIKWGRPSRARHHAASPNVQQESHARGVNDSGPGAEERQEQPRCATRGLSLTFSRPSLETIAFGGQTA